MKLNRFVFAALALGCLATPGFSQFFPFPAPNCQGLPSATQLAALLTSVPSASAGGVFAGTRMWAAVVNRNGVLCAYATNQNDPTQVWPGSQSIAKAKAYTANA